MHGEHPYESRRFRSDADPEHDQDERGHGHGRRGGGPRGSGHRGGGHRGGGHRGGMRGEPRSGGPRGGGRGRGFGGPGGWQQADLPPADDAQAWLTGRLPDEWFVGTPSVTVDREEILVIGELPAPEGTTDENRDAAATGRIGRFREDTRETRMQIADEASARYGRQIAWGASIGDTRVLFTNLAVPVMTRLRHDERRVLDTLVDSGVARSRSDALSWCVKLVGEHADEWLASLRDAMSEVDKLRAEGPEI